MSIVREYVYKIKGLFHGKTGEDLFLILVIILVASGSFGLGRISVSNPKDTIKILYPEEQGIVEGAFTDTAADQPLIEAVSGQFVGSTNGSKYHFPWCGGAQRIKEENKVWFASREEAEREGYTPAANCKGL